MPHELSFHLCGILTIETEITDSAVAGVGELL